LTRPRVAMRKIRDVLRLSLGEKLSRRQVSASLGIPATTVVRSRHACCRGGLVLATPRRARRPRARAAAVPASGAEGHRPAHSGLEVRPRRAAAKSVTLQLLWPRVPRGPSRRLRLTASFANLYRAFRGKVDVVMRQEHRAGEKLFVDFPGRRSPSMTERAASDTQRRAVRRRRRGVELPLAEAFAPRSSCTG